MSKRVNLYVYVRVSIKEQNEDRQLVVMQEFKISEKNVYVDKLYGKDFNRPMYHRVVKKMKKMIYCISKV